MFYNSVIILILKGKVKGKENGGSIRIWNTTFEIYRTGNLTFTKLTKEKIFKEINLRYCSDSVSPRIPSKGNRRSTS